MSEAIEEKKALSVAKGFKFEEGKLSFELEAAFDSNKDGEASAKIALSGEIDLLEAGDEVKDQILDFLANRKK